jgi:hypothetical protein
MEVVTLTPQTLLLPRQSTRRDIQIEQLRRAVRRSAKSALGVETGRYSVLLTVGIGTDSCRFAQQRFHFRRCVDACLL